MGNCMKSSNFFLKMLLYYLHIIEDYSNLMTEYMNKCHNTDEPVDNEL